jgi:septal ring factor EnvC (AmiA/AmiB activator)
VADEEQERRLRKVAIDHAETRWLTLQLDDDVKEIHTQLRAMDTKLDAIDARLADHATRFDSLDAELRSLTQLVGQVLKRLQEPSAVE